MPTVQPWIERLAILALSTVLFFVGSTIGQAQQITCRPGSSSATMTIDGSQLPASPQKFGSTIEREADKSTPMRIVPPKGAHPTCW